MSIQDALDWQEEAWRLQANGRLDEAAAACRHAVRAVEACEGGGSPDVANLLNELAEIEAARQNLRGALAVTDRARAILDGLGSSFDGESAARIRCRTLSLAADLHRMAGEYDSAERDLLRVLELAADQFGDTSVEAAAARNALGMVYKACGRFDDGVRLYEQALTAMTDACGEDSLEAAAVLHNIGGIEHARGDFAAAEAPARRAWEISRRILGDDDPGALLDAAAYAAVLDGLRQYEHGERILRSVLETLERTSAWRQGSIATTLHNLAASVAASGRLDEAEQYYRRALRIKEALYGDAPDAALTCNNLGRLLADRGRVTEAVPLLSRAVAVLERHLRSDHPHLVAARRNLRDAASR